MRRTINRFRPVLMSAVSAIVRQETTKDRRDMGFLDRLVKRIPDGGYRGAKLRSADSGSSLIGGGVHHVR